MAHFRDVRLLLVAPHVEFKVERVGEVSEKLVEINEQQTQGFLVSFLSDAVTASTGVTVSSLQVGQHVCFVLNQLLAVHTELLQMLETWHGESLKRELIELSCERKTCIGICRINSLVLVAAAHLPLLKLPRDVRRQPLVL